MAFKLGIDLGFARNRYEEPEVWAKIVREDLGLSYVSMIADIINPAWPDDYLEKLLERTKNAIDKYDIKIDACFTSALTRTPLLFHFDHEMRRYYLEFYKKFFIMMAKLGCTRGGSHFGIMSFADYDDPNKREQIMDTGVAGWQELSFYAKEIGFAELMFEPMSVPREMGTTVGECVEIMDRVNAHSGVPLKVCLDVGHAPHPDERDPYPWIEKLGHLSPMVHLQQTVLNKSNHSPFTKECNENGIIKAEKVVDAMKKAGATDSLFAFEISHKEHYDTEFNIIKDLAESVSYFRPYIKE